MSSVDAENKVFWGLLASSCAHVVEEYVFPGGFLESAREDVPEAFGHASTPIIVGVNASMFGVALHSIPFVAFTLRAARTRRADEEG